MNDHLKDQMIILADMMDECSKAIHSLPDISDELDDSQKLNCINRALDKYYQELCDRKHGGVAVNQFLQEVEGILGRSWSQFKEKKG